MKITFTKENCKNNTMKISDLNFSLFCIEHGADPTIETDSGYNSMDLAVALGHRSGEFSSILGLFVPMTVGGCVFTLYLLVTVLTFWLPKCIKLVRVIVFSLAAHIHHVTHTLSMAE